MVASAGITRKEKLMLTNVESVPLVRDSLMLTIAQIVAGGTPEENERGLRQIAFEITVVEPLFGRFPRNGDQVRYPFVVSWDTNGVRNHIKVGYTTDEDLWFARQDSFESAVAFAM